MPYIDKKVMLRDFKSALNSPTPDDLVMLVRDGTMVGSSVTITDGAGLKPGSSCAVWAFKLTHTDPTTGELAITAAVAGAAVDVLCLIIADPRDIA